MTLVDDYQAVVLVSQFTVKVTIFLIFICIRIINKITYRTCCYEVNIWRNDIVALFIKLPDCVFPCRPYSRRSDDEHVALSALIGIIEEVFYYQCSDNCLTKSHDISKHKTAMGFHRRETLLDGIKLVFKR